MFMDYVDVKLYPPFH